MKLTRMQLNYTEEQLMQMVNDKLNAFKAKLKVVPYPPMETAFKEAQISAHVFAELCHAEYIKNQYADVRNVVVLLPKYRKAVSDHEESKKVAESKAIQYGLKLMTEKKSKMDELYLGDADPHAVLKAFKLFTPKGN